MSKNLLNSEALGWVLCEHASDKVLGRLAQVGHIFTGFEVERFGADASLALLSVLLKEGKFCGK